MLQGVLKLDLSEADRLAKMVPEAPKMTLPKAYKENPDLEKEKDSSNPLVAKNHHTCRDIGGIGKHRPVCMPAVCLIGRDPLIDVLPVNADKKGNLCLLPSTTVVLLNRVGHSEDGLSGPEDSLYHKGYNKKYIKLSRGIDVVMDEIPLDDQKAFDLFSRGETTGIFQFESPGMKKHLRALKPNRFEDLVAMNALYRPGPMEYIPNFIKRKHGEEEIVYDHPLMEEYLKNTYGITVYQEQVMLQSRALGGFTRGMSDSLRKAMGKKKIKEMDKTKGRVYRWL